MSNVWKANDEKPGNESSLHFITKSYLANYLQDRSQHLTVETEQTIGMRKADILIRDKDTLLEVHEIQLSPQPVHVTKSRTDDYIGNGVESIIWWFLGCDIININWCKGQNIPYGVINKLKRDRVEIKFFGYHGQGQINKTSQMARIVINYSNEDRKKRLKLLIRLRRLHKQLSPYRRRPYYVYGDYKKDNDYLEFKIDALTAELDFIRDSVGT